MACDKITGYIDFTAQQSVVGEPTPEANISHDIEGVSSCGNKVLMGQSAYNSVMQDLRDGIIRTPAKRRPVGICLELKRADLPGETIKRDELEQLREFINSPQGKEALKKILRL